MRAKVKDSYRWRVVRACGGLEFVKGRFTVVPEGREEEAENTSFLEIERSALLTEHEEEVVHAGAIEVEPAPTRRARRSRIEVVP